MQMESELIQTKSRQLQITNWASDQERVQSATENTLIFAGPQESNLNVTVQKAPFLVTIHLSSHGRDTT